MGRVYFPFGEQKRWFGKIIKKSGLSATKLASLCKVIPRTFNDWKNGKFTVSQTVFLKLKKEFKIPVSRKVHILENYWYVSKGARKGGLERFRLYGSPGNVESRRKGGLISQERRRLDPEKYRALGCNVEKVFPFPKKSVYLAETVGIILGDGGITDYQLKITLNRITDFDYAKYVRKLLKSVFGEQPAWYEPRKEIVVNLCISGVNLVNILAKLGLNKGDKIKRQVDFPKWIWRNIDYQKVCVRGLMDTDGCAYFHFHQTQGLKYRNFGLVYTSYSAPLITSVSKVLMKFNIKHSIRKNGRIYIYDLEEIKKYFKIIGSSNKKHTDKFIYHLRNSRRLN